MSLVALSIQSLLTSLQLRDTDSVVIHVVTKFKSPSSPIERAKQEWKVYLTLPVTNQQMFSNSDWWGHYQTQLAMMARLAKSIFSVPATSTLSERLFSKARTLVNERRASLKPSKIDMMLLLNTNYNL